LKSGAIAAVRLNRYPSNSIPSGKNRESLLLIERRGWVSEQQPELPLHSLKHLGDGGAQLAPWRRFLLIRDCI
jgi:hypothetical protein